MFQFPEAETVTREALRKIPVPKREDVSDRWKGVQHGALADLVVARCEANGLRIKSETWRTDGEGADLFGEVEFLREDVPPAPGGFVYALGVVHSNRSKFALRIVVGGKVLVCGNGMTDRGSYQEEGRVRRLHTTGLKVETAVDAGVVKWIESSRHIARTITDLSALDLSGAAGEDRVARALVEAGRRDLLPWSGLGKVDEEWRKPRHPEFEPRTGWSLYNSASEVAKAYSPQRQLRVLDGFSRLILTPGLN